MHKHLCGICGEPELSSGLHWFITLMSSIGGAANSLVKMYLRMMARFIAAAALGFLFSQENIRAAYVEKH